MELGGWSGVVLALLCVVVPSSHGENREEIIAHDYKPYKALELECQSEEYPIPAEATVRWTRDGKPIETTPENEKIKEYEVFTSNNTLRILKIEPAYIGKYVCHYGGNDSVTFDIKIRAYAVPFEKPRNIIQGDPLSLECRVWGVPDPKITWFRDGHALTPDGSAGRILLKNNTGSSDINNVKFPILENGTLRIERMDFDDQGTDDRGNYSCFASNEWINNDNELEVYTVNATVKVDVKDKYAALWPFLGICAEVAILCAIILIYEKRRAKRIEEEERREEASPLNANNDTKTAVADDVRQRK